MSDKRSFGRGYMSGMCYYGRMFRRSLAAPVQSLAFEFGKIAIVSGPRQSGKTFLARRLASERAHSFYGNWDDPAFRRRWASSPESIRLAVPDEPTPLILLDEIHKARLWKRTLKGIYDSAPAPADWLVTGSARMDTFRRGSDSLLGRFLPFRLHPLTLAEIVGLAPPSPEQFEHYLSQPKRAPAGAPEAFDALLEFGPFPEPFARQNRRFSNVWRRSRQELLIRQDLRDLTRLPELGDVELLASLLPERVGSLLSRSSLREDLSVAHTTVARWLRYLEAIYLFFEVKPFSQKIHRAIRKEGKIYLWDYADVPDPGPRFENLVASHLLKAAEFWEDSGHGRFELRYLRNKDGREIDFIMLRGRKPWLLVETKVSDQAPSKSWSTFLGSFTDSVHAVQLVRQPGVRRKHLIPGAGEIQVLSAAEFLGHLP